MRGIVFPAVIATLAATVVATAPLAFAANETTGIVKALDAKAHTLTLDGGAIYYLPAKFSEPGLRAGEKVSVVWNMENGKREASSVMIEYGHDADEYDDAAEN